MRLSRTAKPANRFITPVRSVAAISTSAKKDATSVTSHSSTGAGLVPRERKEVPLASQEGTKGVIQYALYGVPVPVPHPVPAVLRSTLT